MEIFVRFYGTFRTITELEDVNITSEEALTVRDLISILSGKFPVCSQMLDNMLENNLSSSLILLNGVEINNLRGLDSKINIDSEITFLPIYHGG